MAGFEDYEAYDGLGLAELLRAKQVGPRDLLEAAIARIERHNPALNAVVHEMYDAARRTIADGLPEGPFTGVPFLMKDLGALTSGAPTTNGSRLFADYVADHDTTLTERVRTAGLVVMGKTNTPEMGVSPACEPVLHGATRNPWNRSRSPGGSSGGAAAAVAAGLVPMAHGSDGGGSIRIPAANCGLFGLKPTRARNPAGPDVGEGWSGLATIHAVTRSVRDSAALLDATSGPAPGDPYWAPPPARPFLDEVGAAVEPLRIGAAIAGTRAARFSSEASTAVENTAKQLEALGHRVEEAEPDYDAAALGEAFMAIFAVAIAQEIEDRAAATGQTPSTHNLERNNLWLLERGRALSAVDLKRALLGINTATRNFARFFEDYDVWLTPTMATPPPPLGHLDADVDDVELFFERLWTFNPLNSIYNAAGQPAITLPLHMSEDGLPIGVMLGARFGEESLLLRLSAQLETAMPWADRHPPIGLWAGTPRGVSTRAGLSEPPTAPVA